MRFYDGPQTNGYDRAKAIAVDDSGNVRVTGFIDVTKYGDGGDYATIKYDPKGISLWLDTYNGPGDYTDAATDIAVDDSGNVFVTGYSSPSPPPGSADYYTIGYDKDGGLIGYDRYDGPASGSDKARAITVDASGNVYVTGYSDGGGTGYDFLTIKYDLFLFRTWVKRYSSGTGYTWDEATAIAVDGSGNVYVTGVSEGDYLTIKYDASGNLLCSARYNGPGNGFDRATDIALEDCNNFFVTGYSYGGTGTYDDYATIRYNSSCNQIWVRRYNGSGNFGDEANAIAFGFAKNRYGNIYVTGYSTVSWETYATIRYAQFKCGDANCDGNVSVSDVSYLINYLFKGGPPPCPILQSGDVNCDGVVSISDVNYLINYLFKGGPPPCDTSGDGNPDCYGY